MYLDHANHSENNATIVFKKVSEVDVATFCLAYDLLHTSYSEMEKDFNLYENEMRTVSVKHNFKRESMVVKFFS